MIAKSPNQKQSELFAPLLEDFIDMRHELILLSKAIDWKTIEEKLSKHYSHTGKPSKPIRLMVSCLLLKRLYNLGDETLVDAWVMNPYMQYFSGESYFKHSFPFDPSDLVHFRKRIGEEGIEIIFSHTVELHGLKATSKQVISDTTVQCQRHPSGENNITYPTDSKLAKKIIDKCNLIAKGEKVKQRQSYKRVSKQLLRDSYNGSHPRRKKKAKKSQKKLKIITGRLIRELERELSSEKLLLYKEELSLYKRVLSLQPKDKNKIYSLHKPFTACIAKGNSHKKYEYENKVGLVVNPKNLVVLVI